MKPLSLFLPVLAMTLLLSCKPKGETTVETPPLPSADFNVIIVRHDVKDFDAWKSVYMTSDSVRGANGMTHLTTGRGKENPNSLLVANRVKDVEKAKAFINSPETRTRMDSAGVTGTPEINLVHVVRWDTSALQAKDRVIIRHRVKDYDAWLKVYDGEGRDTRAGYGITDRALGRDADDPNMVTIVFYVQDADKLMARIQSEEFKKLTTDAGVEGAPTAFMYSQVE